MTVGDRDMALGLDTVRALAKRAEFPMLSANLVDAETQTPIFAPHAVVERGGLKIGIIGLTSRAGARNTLANVRKEDGPAGWDATDPVPAAVAAVDALAAEGVDVVVALSHLTQQEQGAVAEAAPSIRVFLGGQSMGMRRPGGPSLSGAVAVEAGMKGKQVGFLTLQLAAGTAANAPIVDKDRKKVLEDRLARARVRVESLEKRIATAKEQADGAPTDGPSADATAGRRPPRRIKPPLSLWEQQLAGTRAEVQMVEADLAALAEAPDTAGNTMKFELVNLGQNVADDASVKASVDAFRAKYPDPAKQHAPQVRHPTPGKGLQAPGRITPAPPTKMRPRGGLKPMQPVRRPLPMKPKSVEKPPTP